MSERPVHRPMRGRFCFYSSCFFALIFVFHTQDAMDQFQDEGWDFSGQADAGATSGAKGAGTEAAVTVVPGTSIYQLTEAGIALQATLKGTKFWPDEELNK